MRPAKRGKKPFTLTGKAGTIYAGQTAQVPVFIVPTDKFDGVDPVMKGDHRSNTGDLTAIFIQGDRSKDGDMPYQIGPDSFYTGGCMIEFDIKVGDTQKDNYILDTKNLKPVYETGTTFSLPETFADETYTGSAIKPKVTITKKNTAIELVEGKDFTVTYSNNVASGTAYITIEGIGDYYGTYTRTFEIVGEMDQEIVGLAEQERDLGNGTRTLNSKATIVKYTVTLKQLLPILPAMKRL